MAEARRHCGPRADTLPGGAVGPSGRPSLASSRPDGTTALLRVKQAKTALLDERVASGCYFRGSLFHCRKAPLMGGVC